MSILKNAIDSIDIGLEDYQSSLTPLVVESDPIGCELLQSIDYVCPDACGHT